jgi:hypothetical protein
VGCNLWSQSYEGNSYYLTSASNGLGLQQSFTWQNARNNTWGVPSGDLLDPFVCNSAQSTSPCDVTDDGFWSRIVLTQRSDTVLRLSQAGQGGAQTSTPVTSTYGIGYRMAPLDSYWGDSFDWDVVDFYNWTRFMGLRHGHGDEPGQLLRGSQVRPRLRAPAQAALRAGRNSPTTTRASS